MRELLEELVSDLKAGFAIDDYEESCQYCGKESHSVEFDDYWLYPYEHEETCPVARARILLGITVEPERHEKSKQPLSQHQIELNDFMKKYNHGVIEPDASLYEWLNNCKGIEIKTSAGGV